MPFSFLFCVLHSIRRYYIQQRRNHYTTSWSNFDVWPSIYVSSNMFFLPLFSLFTNFNEYHVCLANYHSYVLEVFDREMLTSKTSFFSGSCKPGLCLYVIRKVDIWDRRNLAVAPVMMPVSTNKMCPRNQNTTMKSIQRWNPCLHSRPMLHVANISRTHRLVTHFVEIFF